LREDLRRTPGVGADQLARFAGDAEEETDGRAHALVFEHCSGGDLHELMLRYRHRNCLPSDYDLLTLALQLAEIFSLVERAGYFLRQPSLRSFALAFPSPRTPLVKFCGYELSERRGQGAALDDNGGAAVRGLGLLCMQLWAHSTSRDAEELLLLLRDSPLRELCRQMTRNAAPLPLAEAILQLRIIEAGLKDKGAAGVCYR
jgi:hypothetical protein